MLETTPTAAELLAVALTGMGLVLLWLVAELVRALRAPDETYPPDGGN